MKKGDACESHDHGPKIKTEFVQITATADSQQDAESLIRLLTEQQLVACAQVQGPETSHEENLGNGWRCRFKTSNLLYPSVKQELDTYFDDRSYSINALPIVRGSDHFLAWLKSQLRQS